jgi:transposase
LYHLKNGLNYCRGGTYLEETETSLVMVNPYHVKQSKELDDNSQTKNDKKDPKVIAKLVIDGRYSKPYVPKGVYADLRVDTASRQRIVVLLSILFSLIKSMKYVLYP